MSGKQSLVQRWFADREPSGSDESSQVGLSEPEREVRSFIETLLDPAQEEAGLAGLQARGEIAARVIASVLAGRIRTRSSSTLLRSDDLSLEYLGKLEKALVAIGPSAAPYVRPLLESKDWPVQCIAAQTAGDLKDRRAVPALVKLLGGASSGWDRVSSAAAGALRKIGDPAAVALLQEVLKDSPAWLGPQIADIIRECSQGEAIPLAPDELASPEPADEPVGEETRQAEGRPTYRAARAALRWLVTVVVTVLVWVIWIAGRDEGLYPLRLIALVLLLWAAFIMWHARWRLTREDLDAKATLERLRGRVAQEREATALQLQAIREELAELATQAGKAEAHELSERIRSKRSTEAQLAERMEILDGKLFVGNAKRVTFGIDWGALEASELDILFARAELVLVPLASLAGVLVIELFGGGALAVGAGLVIAVVAYVVLAQWLFPLYYSIREREITNAWYPLWLVALGFAIPYAAILAFLWSLAGGNGQPMFSGFPFGNDWLGLWVVVVLSFLAWLLYSLFVTYRGLTEALWRWLTFLIGLIPVSMAVPAYIAVLLVVSSGDRLSTLFLPAQLDWSIAHWVSFLAGSLPAVIRILVAVFVPTVFVIWESLWTLGETRPKRWQLLARLESAKLISLEPRPDHFFLLHFTDRLARMAHPSPQRVAEMGSGQTAITTQREESARTTLANSASPAGVFLYAKAPRSESGGNWVLYRVSADPDDTCRSATEILRSILDHEYIKLSRDRTRLVAVVREGEYLPIYLVSAEDGWQNPRKIMHDCRLWLPAARDLYLSDDGTLIVGLGGGCIVLSESDGWRLHLLLVPSETGAKFRLFDGGQVLVRPDKFEIALWDIRRGWDAEITALPLPRGEGTSHWGSDEHGDLLLLGPGAAVIIGSGYFGRGRGRKYSLFVAERAEGRYLQRLVWDSRHEIHLDAMAATGDCAVVSTCGLDQPNDVYVLDRASGWQPIKVLDGIQRVESLHSGIGFVLSVREKSREPYACYAIVKQSEGWRASRLFTYFTDANDFREWPISLKIAPDHWHFAGLSQAADGKLAAVRCYSHTGSLVGMWPTGGYEGWRGRAIEFSPDGQWIAYTQMPEQAIRDEGGVQMVARVDGRDQRSYHDSPWVEPVVNLQIRNGEFYRYIGWGA